MTPHPLLTRLVDYAGLFPPAALPLDRAAAEFAAHRARPEAGMLGRFVVPIAAADALAARLPADLDVSLAVLATPLSADATPPEAIDSLRRDLARAATLTDAHWAITADVLEIRPPDAILAAPAALARLLAAGREAAPDVRIAVEVPWAMQGDGFGDLLAAIRDAGAVLKLRTGGLTPEAFPSADALGAAIGAAHRAGVAFKATAGLHHPLPGTRGGLPMHGFLGVFGGAALVHTGALDASALPAVLGDDDPTAWHLLPDGSLAYRDLVLGGDAVAEARTVFALSVGSCSFDEPVDDLRAMGVRLAP